MPESEFKGRLREVRKLHQRRLQVLLQVAM